MKRVVATLSLLACAPEPSSTVVEIAPAALPSPPPAAAAPLPPVSARPRGPCEAPPSLAGCVEVARVRVGRFEMSSPTCSLDARVRVGEIGSVLRCPTGAVVRFRDATFAGSFAGVSMSACMTTLFPFGGCVWESTQRIEGAPGRDLELVYFERPLENDSCEGVPCVARAGLELVRP